MSKMKNANMWQCWEERKLRGQTSEREKAKRWQRGKWRKLTGDKTEKEETGDEVEVEESEHLPRYKLLMRIAVHEIHAQVQVEADGCGWINVAAVARLTMTARRDYSSGNMPCCQSRSYHDDTLACITTTTTTTKNGQYQ